MELNGKTAVVTGGGNGIGKALCLALAGAGVNVAVADIEEAAAKSVAEKAAERGIKSIGVAADVADESNVAALADAAWNAFGDVDILINNAGVMPPAMPLAATNAADFNWVFAVNVGGVMNGIRTFVPRFAASGRECVVANTASEHSFGVPHIGGGLYTATKHAVLGISDVLRQEAPENLKVCVFCPGIVDSTIWRASERRQESYGGASPGEEAAGELVRQIGMPADEVAAKAIEGIRAERFLIVTHPHAASIAEARWAEIERAFAEQAPRYEGDEKYDLGPIIRQLAMQSAP
ncbi:MAG: SDR family NAD(P)-dependent oxidoreductase [Gammaproteobacteria bacterium]|nr:SDR family NAD(P)-dependent oxidoreductase [Gammaproteobacteria bacterium]MXX07493.1 SDR family NAD(P)-dependent oxidoreductase [Gammaproteobacteria bacterium]MXY90461.1 SDR family NAD(P)-dependent oxidoreductase [Gammaproteobacteria bacterium]MYA37363.1 SDR family NAD(P)-dependent oxidoreductase [Gammaproteobacteria bacterium]MYE28877.1 SDR family NAD(P)-dependent oxidoreductase [Gammaproteobacteria bacterium]